MKTSGGRGGGWRKAATDQFRNFSCQIFFFFGTGDCGNLHLSVAHLLVDQAIVLECVLGSEVIGFLKRKKEKLPLYFNELPVLHTSSSPLPLDN